MRALIAAIHLSVVTATALTFEATPEMTSIVSGAPLGLDLTFSLDEGEFANADLVVFEESRIAVTITDEIGQPINCSRRESPCADGTEFGTMVILGSDREVQLRRAFNKWCTTQLAPGSYRVQVNVQSIGIAEHGEKPLRLVAPSPESDTFELEVRSAEESELNSHLEHLLALAGCEGTRLTKEERARSAQAVEEIVYTTSLQALPYQIKLLRGFVPFGQGGMEACHVSDLATHFVAMNDPRVAEELVALFGDIKQGRVSLEHSRSHVESVVLWTLHELHENSNAEVAEITRPVTMRYSKPRDPRRGPP